MTRKHSFTLLPLLGLLGISNALAHQEGAHPTNLAPLEEAQLALSWFYLYGAGVAPGPKEDPLEPQEFTLLNSSPPGGLPTSIFKIGWALGSGHASQYYHYLATIQINGRVETYPGNELPAFFLINPLLDGWSGIIEVELRNQICDLTLKARASWNLAPPRCRPCTSLTCSSSASIGSVELDVPVGPAWFGTETVGLAYHADTTVNQGPSGLALRGRTGTLGAESQMIDGVLQWVSSGGQLARVIPTPTTPSDDDNAFEIHVSADPELPEQTVYRITRIENLPAQGDSPQSLLVTERLNGHATTREFRNPDSQTWILVENGLRRTTRSTISDTGTNRVRRHHVEERNASGAWTSVSLIEEEQTHYTWGWETIRESLDPDGRNLTTTWAYYDYAYDAPSGPAAASRGRLASVEYPTGLVRNFEYHDTDTLDPTYQYLEIIREHFAGDPSARETRRHIKRTYNQRFERIESLVDGTLVEQTDIETYSAGSTHWRTVSRHDGGSGAPSVTRYEYDGNPATPLISRTIFPDGTIEEVYETFRPSLVSTEDIYTRTAYTGTPAPSGSDPPVLTGEQTKIVIDDHAQVVQWEKYALRNGSPEPLIEVLPVTHDTLQRPTAYDVYHGGRAEPTYRGEIHYGCCGISSVRGADRTPVYYYYDGLGRRYKTHRNGIAQETVFDGLSTHHHRYPEAEPNSLPASAEDKRISTATRDLAGLPASLTTRSPADNSWITTGITTEFQPAGTIGRRQTITLPPVDDDLGVPATIVEEWFTDGLPASISGSLAADQTIAYNATAAGLESTTSLIADDRSPRESTTTRFDWLGRPVSVVFSGDADGDDQPDQSTAEYDLASRPIRITDPDGVVTLFAYDLANETLTTAIDIDRDGAIDPAHDQVSFSRDGNGNDDSGTTRWTEQGVITPAGTYEVLQRIELASDGLATWIDDFPAAGGAPTRLVTTPVTGTPDSWDHSVWLPDGTSSLLKLRGGLRTEKERFDANGTSLGSIQFQHDAWQRLTRVVDDDGPDLAIHYLAPQVDAVDRRTLGGTAVEYEFDHRGRVTAVDLPDTTAADGSTVTNRRIAAYWPHDGLRTLSGQPGETLAFTWDHAHRLESLTAAGGDSPTTRWHYDPDRGWPVAKRYHGQDLQSVAGPNLGYTAAGRTKTRTDARGVVTTWNHGPDGLLTSINYSDGTPGIVFTARDHQGRPTGISDAAGSSTIAYGPTGEISSLTHQAGHLMAAWSASSPRDTLGRLTGLQLSHDGQTRHQLGYQYDSAGRLSSVESSRLGASYHYLPGTRTVRQLAFSDPLGPVAYDTRNYDGDRRLLRKTVHNGRLDSGLKVFSDYQLGRDETGRIKTSTLADGTHWQFDYHPSGALAAADRKIDGTTLPGHSLRWDFDVRGNPASLRRDPPPATPTTLLANPLDQLTSISRPGEFQIFGEAPPTHEVTVNGDPATRDGSFFHHLLAPPDPGAPSSAQVLVESEQGSHSGTVLIPPAQLTPSYDAAGNLLGDGIFQFTWDAENRLRQAETTAAATAAGIPYARIAYTYDHQSRMLARDRYDSPSAPTPADSTRFLHAGWRCLGELDADNQLTRTLAWGLDPASDLHLGDPNSALLWLHDHSDDTRLIAHADPRGHLAGLIDSRSRQSAARYLHSPFGETLAATGPKAATNPWRYSTHFQDPDTSLIHYGLRWLNPQSTQWLSRDPLGEAESPNLYQFVGNDPVNEFDLLGGKSWTSHVQNTRQALNDHVGKIMTGISGLGAGIAASAAGPFSTTPAASAAAAEWGMNWNTGGVIGGSAGGAITDPLILKLEECVENQATKQTLKRNNLEDQYSPHQYSTEDYLDRVVEGGGVGAVGGFIGSAAKPFVSAVRRTPLRRTGSIGIALPRKQRSLPTPVSQKSIEKFEIVPYSGQPTPGAWPGNRGFLGTPSKVTLQPGIVIDRYGSRYGTFVAPEGTPFPMRALPDESLAKPFEAYRVRVPMEVDAGLTVPAFEKPGLGPQYELPLTVDELIQLKVLEPITP